MADITLCKGHQMCGFQWNCKRYQYLPKDRYQSYFIEAPLNLEKMTCDFYCPIKKKGEKNESQKNSLS